MMCTLNSMYISIVKYLKNEENKNEKTIQTHSK